MKLTPEQQLFKEAIIKEYKSQHEKAPKPTFYKKFRERLNKLIPLNIAVGVGAAALLVSLQGWDVLIYLLLSGVIWLTLISTIVSAFLSGK